MNELDYRIAIEALENHVAQTRPIYETAKAIDYLKKAHQEALAKQEQGEPSRAERLLAHVEDFAKRCGWSKESGEGAFECVQRTSYAQGVEDVKLQRKPLTDEQIHEIYDAVARQEPYMGAVTRRNIVRAIEAAHGIKGEA